MNPTDVEKARVWLREVDVNEVIETTGERIRKAVREHPLVSVAAGFLLGVLLARRSGR